jgi:PAS domain S-box-containing protein
MVDQQHRRALEATAESLIAVAALALLTWVGHRLDIHSGPAAVLTFCAVVLVSLRGRLAPALVIAVGGTVAWSYLFTGPEVTFADRQLRAVAALVAFCATAVVITRLVRALHASEGRWRNVFENNPTMYFMVDASGIVLSVNSFGAEQLGYTVAELVGQSVLTIFLEEDRTAARAHLARCLAHLGQSLTCWDLRTVRKDGTTLWVREMARAVELEPGRPVVLIACVDITEQKEAQDRLRESEAHLRAQASLLDLTHDAIIERDPNDVIVYWNRGAEESYGWSSAEAFGKVTHELLRTVFPEPLGEITAKLLRTGRWEGELVHTKRDGERTVMASRWSLRRDADGQPAGVLATNNDITERIHAEGELRRSQAYLAEAQRLSRTGSFGWDTLSGTITWSEETYRIFGVEPGTPPSIDLVLQRTHPEDRADVQRTIERAQRDSSDFEHEYRLLLPDGSVKHLNVVSRGLTSDSGQHEFVGAIQDVTERERAAEALRRSEAYLAEAQRLTHTGSWALNLAPKEIVHWSEEEFRLHGLDPKDGIPPWEILNRSVHPEDRTRVDADFAQALRDKVDFEVEFRRARPDGTFTHIRSAGHPMFDASGEVVGYVGASIDVTAEKEAEEERRAHVWFLESMDRVNRAIQGTGDVEQMMSDVLEAVRSLFDCDGVALSYPCDPDAASLRVVMQAVRPELRDADTPPFPGLPVDAETARLLQILRASNGPVRVDPASEHSTVTPGARQCGVQSGLAMALYPKVDSPYLFALDQRSYARVWTPREERLFQEIGRRLADALTTLLVLRDQRESARRYQNIFQMAEVSIWEEDFSRVKAAIDQLRAGGVEDFRGYFAEHPEFVAQAVQMVRVIDVNDATVTLFGARDKADLLRSVDKVFTTDSLPVLAEVLLAVAEGRSSFGAEASLQTVNGDRLAVLFTMAFPEPGKLDNALVSVMDITARRRAEAELQRAQAELVRAGALTTMGELAASIAHELRQPLAAIVMSGSAALRWLNRGDPDLDEARDAASRTVKEAQRAAEVIRGLGELLRNRALQRAPFDINRAIDEVLALVRGKVSQSDIAVRTALARDLPLVFGDRVQLEQVLLNLVLNGMDAISSVEGGARELVLRTERAGPEGVAIAIDDTGVGLDPATAERIFDRFFTTKENGLGMGLSICRSIVEAHGGRLSASPRSPRGATFRFTVPTEASAADRDTRSAATVSADAVHGGSAAGGLTRA